MVKRRAWYRGPVDNFCAPCSDSISIAMGVHDVPYAELCEAIVERFKADYADAKKGRALLGENRCASVNELEYEAQNSLLAAIIDFYGGDVDVFLAQCAEGG